MKFFVVGDSFVRRLGELVERSGEGVSVCNDPVVYFGWGGSTVDGIRRLLASIPLESGSVAMIAVGGNDLCVSDPKTVSRSLMELAHMLLGRA